MRDPESGREKEKRERANRSKVYSADEQRRFVELWRSSGLRQVEFCKQQGIKEWQLSNWKTRPARKARGSRQQESKTQFAEVEFGEIYKDSRDVAPVQAANVASAEMSAQMPPEVTCKVVAEIRLQEAVISIFDGANSYTVREIISALMERKRDLT